MSLKQKALSGIKWTFVDTFVVKGVTFIAMLFLARWIGPDEFGLVGIMAIFMGIGTSLVDSGLSSSIIRTPDTTHLDYSTVFFMNFSMSILIYGILFFTAPFIASYFEQESLTLLVRIYCLSFMISAFSAIQIAILTKELRFKRLAVLNLPSVCLGVSVGLLLGYFDYGVWSVVFMFLSTEVCYSILLWLSSEWKPKFEFSKDKLKHHLNFGYKLSISGLLDITYKNIYNILIGKYYPLAVLGHFERAKQLNSYPSTILTSIVGKVTYPLLSKIQGDKDQISAVYKQLLQISFFITAPIMLGGAAIAEPLFDILLGKEWVGAAKYFQILSIASMLYPVHAFNINILKVYGRSDLFLKLELIKKVLASICLIIGFQFGIMGIVWAVVVSSVLALLVNTYFSSKLIDFSFIDQIKSLLPSLFISSLTFLLMFRVVFWMNDFSSVLQLIIASIIGGAFYLVINYLKKGGVLFQVLKLMKR